MRQCYDHRRSNWDAKMIEQLRYILDYCNQTGHAPLDGSEHARRFYNIGMVIAKRRRAGNPVPNEVFDMLARIKAFPNEKRYQKNAALQAAADAKLYRDNRIGEIEQIFPSARVLFRIFGKEAFNRLIYKSNNKLALKIFSEYFDSALDSTSVQPYRASDKEILLMYTGGVLPVRSLERLNQMYGIDFEKIMSANPDGLRAEEIAELLNLSCGRIHQIVIRSVRKMNRKINCDPKMSQMFEYCLAGDANAMLADMDMTLRHKYETQQKYNIFTVSTRDLDAAGKWILNNFDMWENTQQKREEFLRKYNLQDTPTHELNFAGLWLRNNMGKLK